MALSTQEKKPPVFGGKSPGGLQASKWKTGKGWTVNVSEYSLRAGGIDKAEGALGEGVCRTLHLTKGPSLVSVTHKKEQTTPAPTSTLLDE